MMGFRAGLILMFLIIAFGHLSECHKNDVTYNRLPSMDDKVCPANQQLFSAATRSGIMCLEYCSRYTSCNGAFFNTLSGTCAGCQLQSSDTSTLLYVPGTIAYTIPLPPALTCGRPPIVNHVSYSENPASSQFGDMITFTCSTCTYRSMPGEPGYVTCLNDGSWTTPICVTGADAGWLPNGVRVPDGAKGCREMYNSTCPNEARNAAITGTRYNYDPQTNPGDGTCYCDSICCDSLDCCYDYGC